jgi:hypothetical protein
MKRTWVFPFLGLALLGLLAGLWAGLARIGWVIPSPVGWAGMHGPLMVSGFLGVLIPLERAVAMRKTWMFAAPALAGIGWVSLLIWPSFGMVLLTLAALCNLGILISMVRREPAIHTWVMAAGALAWLAGNTAWLVGQPLYKVVFCWLAFLILTIGGERLELNRVLRPSRAALRVFNGLAACLGIGTVLAFFWLEGSARLSGLAMLGLGLWFLRYDIAGRNLRHPNPLTRYIALCLFSGFGWLAVGGLFYASQGALITGLMYDAALHAVFVGFVISMIFGHAPIIFPAILGTPINFSRLFYIQLGLLHSAMVLRVVGDLFALTDVRRWGGLLSELSILLFLGLIVRLIVRERLAAFRAR